MFDLPQLFILECSFDLCLCIIEETISNYTKHLHLRLGNIILLFLLVPIEKKIGITDTGGYNRSDAASFPRSGSGTRCL